MAASREIQMTVDRNIRGGRYGSGANYEERNGQLPIAWSHTSELSPVSRPALGSDKLWPWDGDRAGL